MLNAYQYKHIYVDIVVCVFDMYILLFVYHIYTKIGFVLYSGGWNMEFYK